MSCNALAKLFMAAASSPTSLPLGASTFFGTLPVSTVFMAGLSGFEDYIPVGILRPACDCVRVWRGSSGSWHPMLFGHVRPLHALLPQMLVDNPRILPNGSPVGANLGGGGYNNKCHIGMFLNERARGQMLRGCLLALAFLLTGQVWGQNTNQFQLYVEDAPGSGNFVKAPNELLLLPREVYQFQLRVNEVNGILIAPTSALTVTMRSQHVGWMRLGVSASVASSVPTGSLAALRLLTLTFAASSTAAQTGFFYTAFLGNQSLFGIPSRRVGWYHGLVDSGGYANGNVGPVFSNLPTEIRSVNRILIPPTGTEEVTVTLTSMPSAAVTVAATSSSPGTVSVLSTVTIAANAWQTGGVLTLSSVARGRATLTLRSSSADRHYNGDEFTLTAMSPGIDVTPSSPRVREARKLRLTVTLVGAPSAGHAVTVSVESSDSDEGTVLPSLLTLSANGETAQVTLTGVDDAHVRADEFDVEFSLSSGDSNFNGFSETVSVSVREDDRIGLTVSPTRLYDGFFRRITLTLGSEPVDPVTVSMTAGRSRINPGLVTIAAGTTTVTTRVNLFSDGFMTVSLSGDAAYDGETYTFELESALLISVTPRNATVAEAGGLVTLTVTLNHTSVGGGSVTISPATRTGEVMFSPASLTLAGQGSTGMFTVSGVPDREVHSASIIFSYLITGGDSVFDRFSESIVNTVTVTDDDVASLGVPDAVLRVGEVNTVTVTLGSEPLFPVTLTATTSMDATVSVLSPMVTVSAGATLGEIRLSGVAKGSEKVTLSSSGDATYVGIMHTATVTVAGIDVTPSSPTVGEDSGTSTLTVTLVGDPSAGHAVTVSVESTDSDEGTVSPSALTLSAAGGTAQVTLTGVDDAHIRADEFDVAFSLSSGDSNFNGLSETVSVSVTEDDSIGLTVSPMRIFQGFHRRITLTLGSEPLSPVTVSMTEGNDINAAENIVTIAAGMTTGILQVRAFSDNVATTISLSGDAAYNSETYTFQFESFPIISVTPRNATVVEAAGGLVTITVTLNHTSNNGNSVTVSQSPPFSDEVMLSPSLLTLAGQGSTGQFTVSAVSDRHDRPNVVARFNYLVRIDGSLFRFSSRNTVTVTDDDVASLGVPDAVRLRVGSEHTVTVTLGSEPVDPVTLTATAAMDATVSVLSPLVTLAASATLGEVRLSGVAEGSEEVTLSSSGDAAYAGMTHTLTATVRSTGIDVTPSPSTVGEDSGTSTLTVTLVGALATGHAVTVSVESADSGEGTVSPSLLTLSADGETAQVTVTGVDDAHVRADEFDVEFSLSSGDSNFNGLSETVSVSVTEDDSIGLTVSPMRIFEFFRRDITLTLGSEPVDPVTVSMTGGSGSQIRPGLVTIAAGTTTATTQVRLPDGFVTMSLSGDAAYNSETYTFELESAPLINVTPENATVAEAGGLVTVTVTLNHTSSNGNRMTISPSTSSDEVMFSPSLLTLAGQGSTGQFTVSGVPDRHVLPNAFARFSYLVHGIDGSSTRNLTFRFPNTVTVTDDDVASLGVPAPVRLRVGGEHTVTVTLGSEPLSPVTLTATASMDATVSVLSPLVTVAASATLGEVRLSGVVEGSEEVTLSSSGDAAYAGMDATLTATVRIAGIDVMPRSPTVSEFRGTEEVTVTLVGDPSAGHAVTVSVTGVDRREARVTPLALTLNADGGTGVLTLTGVDDDASGIGTGDTQLTLSLGLSSGDGGSSGHAGQTEELTVTLLNDDGGLSLTPGSLRLTEGGSAVELTASLSGPRPAESVTVALTPERGLMLTPQSVVFSPPQWTMEQTVEVSAAVDGLLEGVEMLTLRAQAQSGGSPYVGLRSDLDLEIVDADVAGYTVSSGGSALSSGSALTVAEGSSALLTLRLLSDPRAGIVTVSGIESVSALTVTPVSGVLSSRSSDAVLTVTGVDDGVQNADGHRFGVVTLSVSGGGLPPEYGVSYGRSGFTLSVRVTDDDRAGLDADRGEVSLREGGSEVLRVRLGSRPQYAVTVSVVSLEPDLVASEPGELVFSPQDWSRRQELRLTAAEDANAQDESVVVRLAPRSRDVVYSRVAPVAVVARVRDNDVAGLMLTRQVLYTAENGAEDFLGVRLLSSPPEAVTVSAASSDTTEVTVSPSALTFGPLNWSQEQTLTATGAAADGDTSAQTVTLTLASASGGMAYAAATEVRVVNTEAAVPARLRLSRVSGLSVRESGTAATLSVSLATEPTAMVTVSATSSDPTEATVSPLVLTFAPSAWNVAQEFVVTGVADDVVDGAVAFTLTLDASSADSDYNGLSGEAVGVNGDANRAGLSVELSRVDTDEGGGSRSFEVRLSARPSQAVTVSATSSDAGEATVSPSALIFAPAAWNVAQTLTATGQDDDEADGAAQFTLTLDASSADSAYAPLTATVAGVNGDNDRVGLLASPERIATGESGDMADILVRLASRPASAVMVLATSSDVGEATVSPSALTFAPAAWNTVQTVTVTGVDDADADGPSSYQVLLTATSSDVAYAALTAAVQGLNVDDDSGGVVLSPLALTVREGDEGTFGVRLSRMPSSSAMVSVTSSDAGEATVSPSALTFAPGMWNTEQTVTVSGVADGVADGDVALTVRVAVTGAGDGNVLVTVPNADMLALPRIYDAQVGSGGILRWRFDCANCAQPELLQWRYAALSSGVALAAAESCPSQERRIAGVRSLGDGAYSGTAQNLGEGEEIVRIYTVASQGSSVADCVANAAVNAAALAVPPAGLADAKRLRTETRTMLAILDGQGAAQLASDLLRRRLETAGSAEAQLSLGGTSLLGGNGAADPSADPWDRQADRASQRERLRGLIRSGTFALPLRDGDRRQTQLWGAAGFAAFDGDPLIDGTRFDYDGDATAFHVGIDTRFGSRLRGGVALGATDASIELAGDARLRSLDRSLVALHPYLGWRQRNSDAWLAAGFGTGEYTARSEMHGSASGDADMAMAAFGYRHTWDRTDVRLAARISANAAHSRLRRAAFADRTTLPAVDAESWRIRTAFDAELPYQTSFGLLTPGAGIAARLAGGDAGDSSALDATASLNARSATGIDAQLDASVQITGGSGRLHSLRGSFAFDPGRDRRGFSTSLDGARGVLSARFAYAWGRILLRRAGRLETHLGAGLGNGSPGPAIGFGFAAENFALSLQTASRQADASLQLRF